MNPDRREVGIQQFLDIKFEEPIFPATTLLQKLLPDLLSSGSANEELAEFLATMIYNLEASLVNTKEALIRIRVACTSMMAEVVAIQSDLIEQGFAEMTDRQTDFFEKMNEDLNGPHWDALFQTGS